MAMNRSIAWDNKENYDEFELNELGLNSPNKLDHNELDKNETVRTEPVTKPVEEIELDRCFLCLCCNEEKELQYAKLCCGTTIYHIHCMKDYCEKQLNDKQKLKITCQICHKDMTEKINVDIKYRISYEKIYGWVWICTIIALVISSCISYSNMPFDTVTRTGFILTYVFGTIISFYMMLNSIDYTDVLLYCRRIEILFAIEIIVNPFILLCTSLVQINHPNRLSYLTVNYIFIGIGCGSLIGYIAIWYMHYWLINYCIHIPYIIWRGCSCVIGSVYKSCACILGIFRSCCMDDTIEYSIKGEYISNKNNNTINDGKVDNV